MKTKENLMTAFAGESQANLKYLAFAKKAEKEGLPQIAQLFRTIAEAETIHAFKEFETAGKVGSTIENLKVAVEGEIYEFSKMYPEFIATAEEEKELGAKKAFQLANEAEKVHAAIYKLAIAAAEAGKDIDVQSFYFCPVCGYVSMDGAPERCPICNLPKEKFVKN